MGIDDFSLAGDVYPQTSTPSHYEGALEPIDLIEAQVLDFNEGNVIKYVCRYKRKNGLEDLKKAKYYLERLIAEYED